MKKPSLNQPVTAAEQEALHGARAKHERCACGQAHDDDDYITPATIGRMRAYLALHPGHQFAIDEDAGIIALILAPALNASGPLQILDQDGNLLEFLDRIGAPPAETMS